MMTDEEVKKLMEIAICKQREVVVLERAKDKDKDHSLDVCTLREPCLANCA